MLTSFVADYIQHINSDIFSLVEFYKTENNQLELDKIEKLMAPIHKNVEHHFQRLIHADDVKSISRLGDMHANNSCTLLLDYGDKKLVYKPYDIPFLTLVNKIQGILNSSKKFCFYSLKLLFQNEHGSYVEYIEDEAPDDLDKYSYHFGALIFILTLLRGTDFHSENIFCKSSIPVIVDYETFFFPHINGIKEYSVEATSLIKTKNNSQTLMHKYKLNINRIFDGINDAFLLIDRNKAQVNSFIEEYHHLRARVIFKPTAYYFKILENSTHPVFLSNKKYRMQYLHECLGGGKTMFSFLFKHELEDLLNFNIPIFYFEKGNLYSSGMKLIEQNLLSSSLKLIINELKNLNFFKNRIIEVLKTL